MIRIANAPCSWGVLEFGLDGETAGYGQVLDEMVVAGYAGTELGDWGFMPSNPAELRSVLQQRGLELVAAFVPMKLTVPEAEDEGIARGMKTAQLMAEAGFSEAQLVLSDDNAAVPGRRNHAGRITPDLMADREAMAAAAQVAVRFAEAVMDASGLRTVFHHHCAGYFETPAEIEKMLSAADNLGLVLDTGHYRFGGGYPEAAVRLFPERIWHVHFKDCSAEIAARSRRDNWDYFRSIREGIFCELGAGEVDFAMVLAELRRANYEGWIVVEQDVLPGMGSPLDCARRNRQFLASFNL